MRDRPPGEGARGEGGRAGMFAGERGSAAEKREKLREWGVRRLLKSNFDCTRPVGRTARTRRGRTGGHVRGGARVGVGRGEEGEAVGPGRAAGAQIELGGRPVREGRL